MPFDVVNGVVTVGKDLFWYVGRYRELVRIKPEHVANNYETTGRAGPYHESDFDCIVERSYRLWPEVGSHAH